MNGMEGGITTSARNDFVVASKKNSCEYKSHILLAVTNGKNVPSCFKLVKKSDCRFTEFVFVIREKLYTQRKTERSII